MQVVYRIRNLATGKVYIGSSKKGLGSRRYLHLRDLKKGSHHSVALQADWNKYGAGGFAFEVVETVDVSDLLVLMKARLRTREQFWMDQTECATKGYNTSPSAFGNAGAAFYQTESFKEKHRRKFDRLGFAHHKPLPRLTKEQLLENSRPLAKLTDTEVESIRSEAANGVGQDELAARYSVCQQTISNIVRRRGIVYGGTSRVDYKPKMKHSVITPEQREAVKVMRRAGRILVDIAAETGFSKATISNISREP